MKLYKQCVLTEGNNQTTGWIEERGARVGVSVEINGTFWEVVSVGSVEQNMEEIDRTGRTKFPSINK